MAFTLNISGGVIHKDDTKKLTVTPKDEDGNAFVPATLTATFTPPSGSADTYTLAGGDFSGPTSGAYDVRHTFDEVGPWHVTVAATDADGNGESESIDVYVNEV